MSKAEQEKEMLMQFVKKLDAEHDNTVVSCVLAFGTRLHENLNKREKGV